MASSIRIQAETRRRGGGGGVLLISCTLAESIYMFYHHLVRATGTGILIIWFGQPELVFSSFGLDNRNWYSHHLVWATGTGIIIIWCGQPELVYHHLVWATGTGISSFGLGNRN